MRNWPILPSCLNGYSLGGLLTQTRRGRGHSLSPSPQWSNTWHYAELLNNMLTAFRNLDCNMSVKMHYLFSYMDRFLENRGSMSDEQGEIFHQDLKEMETRYQGRWDAVMMANYCWNLKRDLPAAEHSRSSKKRKFKPWSLNNGEATCNLRVLTFINAHHSVYSNRCFYQVINIYCWPNIFSFKNIFRMIYVDKNQLIMPQKCNRFCHKIWLFSNQLSTKPDLMERNGCHFLIQQCKNTLNQL